MKKKKTYIYLVRDKINGLIYGCFNRKRKAINYMITSDNAFVDKLEVI